MKFYPVLRFNEDCSGLSGSAVRTRADAMMRIWKLTPIDAADPVWKGYDTKPMLVRAENAREAQALVELATIQYISTTSGYLQGNPWRYTV